MFNDYHSVKGSKNTKNSLSLVHLKNQNSEKKKKKSWKTNTTRQFRITVRREGKREREDDVIGGNSRFVVTA